MAQNLTLLLTIRTLTLPGEKILGNRWLPFLEYLRHELREQGRESALSSDDLLVFLFPQGLAAVPLLLTALVNSKEEHGWPQASGPSPLQIVLDIVPPGTSGIAPRLPDPALWDRLPLEGIYVTPDLEERWQQAIQEIEPFPSHKIEADDAGLSRVIFFDHDIGNRQNLLAFRLLPVAGQGAPCFYCGMRSHAPSLCPSKFLTMSAWGLSQVGYLTFAEINTLYQIVFADQPPLVAELATGLTTAQIRKNPKLLTFVSFFDISALFQPRFLWNFAFSGHGQWEAIYLPERIKIDNRNLHLGLDCLRVGHHEQAMAILDTENRRKDGDRFAANIGLAFCSLELNRASDMRRYLNEARNQAHQSREVVYCNLLLSRLHELREDFWNAKDAVAHALKADYHCLDSQYRRLQLAVREGLSEREIKLLRTLLVSQKELFVKALLDPHLLPIQGLLDDILSQQYSVIARDARKNLKNGRREAEALAVWLDDNDPRHAEHQTTLQQLEQQLEHSSYFDLLEVSERSNALFFTCRRLHKEKADGLHQELSQMGQHLEGFLRFWKGYSYKKFFQKFQKTLLTFMKKNQQARLYLKENRNQSSRQAILLADQLRQEYPEIKKEYGRLLWVRTTLNGLRLFAKRLLLSEIALLILLALIFPVLVALLADKPGLAWLLDLAAHKAVQRNALIIATLFIAPFIALAWTMVDLQKKQ
ncbi:MAG: hypothetical protein RI601_03790 [Desulfurivibrionaceae bacterium]|nr:hypothetical protein [Desulfurivibrionaceae bacterium]